MRIQFRLDVLLATVTVVAVLLAGLQAETLTSAVRITAGCIAGFLLPGLIFLTAGSAWILVGAPRLGDRHSGDRHSGDRHSGHASIDEDASEHDGQGKRPPRARAWMLKRVASPVERFWWTIVMALLAALLSLFVISVFREARQFTSGLTRWLVPMSLVLGVTWLWKRHRQRSRRSFPQFKGPHP